MDAAERALLETTVTEAVAGADGPIDDILTHLGWFEMLATEPRDATDVVFAAVGRTNAAAGVLDDVVTLALGVEPGADLAVLLPPFATWDPPGGGDGNTVRAVGMATVRMRTASDLLVVRGGAEPTRVVVPVSAVRATPVRGIDPDARLHAVEFVDGAARDEEPLDPGAWSAAVAAGRRALAHQLAGASRAMLALARAHAVERVQFGRPIARFQAVQHRLADALVAIEALEATLTAAWDEPGPMTAALAKAVAGRTARTVAGHCQQVLAGTGFTVEHPFHRYLKRTMALEGLFGSADQIALEAGQQLLATRTVPTLVEL